MNSFMDSIMKEMDLPSYIDGNPSLLFDATLNKVYESLIGKDTEFLLNVAQSCGVKYVYTTSIGYDSKDVKFDTLNYYYDVYLSRKNCNADSIKEELVIGILLRLAIKKINWDVGVTRPSHDDGFDICIGYKENSDDFTYRDCMFIDAKSSSNSGDLSRGVNDTYGDDYYLKIFPKRNFPYIGRARSMAIKDFIKKVVTNHLLECNDQTDTERYQLQLLHSCQRINQQIIQ